MSMLLTARSLEKAYSHGPLFTQVSLRVDQGDRLALIGPNGSGKSTLLKILANQAQPDQGELTTRRNLRTAYVAQYENFPADTPALDIITQAMADHLHDPHDRDIQARILLSRVGFDDPHQPAGQLSGGWRKRLAIAQALARDPQLLLMDEPTNHLDLEGILWLESYLTQGSLPFGLVVVTHDRYFLQAVATRVVELNQAYPEGTFECQGDYARFLEKREAFLQSQLKQQQALAGKVRQDIAWLSRGAKARRTKAKGRIKEAGQRMEQLADLQHRNNPAKAAGIDFTATGRKTRKLLTAKNITHAMGGKPLFANLDLELAPGDCLGLMGPNGSGKSTLIRILQKQLLPDHGTIQTADNLRIVTFTQHREALDPRITLRDALCPVGDAVHFQGRPMHVVTWAQRFLFDKGQLNVPVGDLSGGEQSRIFIAQLMLQPADLLILDEPTNDLDIPSLEVLEQSLEAFAGAIVLVSHDRYLIDRLSTNIIGLDGQGNARHYADYFQWEDAWQAQREASAKTPAATPDASSEARESSREATASSPSPKRARKLSYKEQREWDTMEENIVAAEEAASQAQAKTADPAILADHVKLADACRQLEAAQAKVTNLYTRWQELEAIQSPPETPDTPDIL